MIRTIIVDLLVILLSPIIIIVFMFLGILEGIDCIKEILKPYEDF